MVLLVLLVEALLVIMYYGYLYLTVYPETDSTKKKKEHSDRTKKCGPLPDGGLVWNSNCTIECDDHYVHDESGETCSCDKSLGYISDKGGCKCDKQYETDVNGNCICPDGTSGVPPNCKKN